MATSVWRFQRKTERGYLRIRIAKYYKGFPTKVKQNLRRHESHCD